MNILDVSRRVGKPIQGTEIDGIEQHLGFSMPEQYKMLLSKANGASLNNGILLYSSSNLIERNSTWEVARYAPGFLCIGDNGGGKLVLIRIGNDDPRIYGVEVGSLRSEDMWLLASNIDAWSDRGFPIEGESAPSESFSELVDIYLECMPPGGFKELVKFRDILGLEVSLGELKRASDNLPTPIAKGLHYGKVRARCRKAGVKLDPCLVIRKKSDPQVVIYLD